DGDRNAATRYGADDRRARSIHVLHAEATGLVAFRPVGDQAHAQVVARRPQQLPTCGADFAVDVFRRRAWRAGRDIEVPIMLAITVEDTPCELVRHERTGQRERALRDAAIATDC